MCCNIYVYYLRHHKSRKKTLFYCHISLIDNTTDIYHRIKHLYLIHMVCLWLCQAKYITVVFHPPYRRYMWILLVYLHGFLHKYITYKCPLYFYIYIHISHRCFYITIYICLSTDIYICAHTYFYIYRHIISSHYILTASVFSLRYQLACNQRTNVLFNTLEIINVIYRMFSPFSILKYSI